MSKPMSKKEIDSLDVEEALEQYIHTALWSSVDENEDPFDLNYGPEDIAPEAKRQMREDVEDFLRSNQAMILTWGREGTAPSQAGHDFWLTRNGHGAGFWDGDWGEAGTPLSDACKPYGSCDLYVGDDGLIYCL